MSWTTPLGQLLPPPTTRTRATRASRREVPTDCSYFKHPQSQHDSPLLHSNTSAFDNKKDWIRMIISLNYSNMRDKCASFSKQHVAKHSSVQLRNHFSRTQVVKVDKEVAWCIVHLLPYCCRLFSFAAFLATILLWCDSSSWKSWTVSQPAT